MPGRFLTTSERERLNRFPEEISSADIFTFFRLSEFDLSQIPIKSKNYNRLGFTLQLCALRYLGFCPDDLMTAPISVISYVAEQIGVDAEVITFYNQREQTRTEHFIKISDYLGFRKASKKDIEKLSIWLNERALEHNEPILLFYMSCERLYSEKIVRLGVTSLERMVISAIQQADETTYKLLYFLMTEERKEFFDNILIPDNDTYKTKLFWLRQGATSNTPKAILETIEKLAFLRKAGVEHWDLSSINPNRRKYLAQIGRKSSNQAIQRLIPQRRYPILITFLYQSLENIIDELVGLFDRCLADCYSRSKTDKDKFQLSIAKTTNEKLRTFREIGYILLDTEIQDSQIRDIVYNRIPKEILRSSIEECAKLIRPRNDKCYDYLVSRYSYIREFVPAFLNILNFYSHKENDPLIEALETIKELNEKKKRDIPEGTSLKFIPKSWLPYVKDKKGKIIRRYFEICALWELRGALRSGNVWIKNSRRYADIETYLIPKDNLSKLHNEDCSMPLLLEDGVDRLKCRQKELENAIAELDRVIPNDDHIRIEKNKLVLSTLKAEELPESSIKLQNLITERLPLVELTDLLIEVDNWTHFTDCFEHAGDSFLKTKEILVYLYASIFALACNFGFKKMAEISNLSYDKLEWYNNWYIREETLQDAINLLVDFQYNQPLSKYWGNGTLSSSDGQRFLAPIKTKNATALPKYFGYGRGLTFYSWTSDQFSQYGSKVIPTTIRDATYVLDAILDNETELNISEHTTDTAGYTDLVFALFDLLGMQFSPRIRDIGDQRIFRPQKGIIYKNLNSLLSKNINYDLIINNWDDILRVVASIKFGWVTASLFISKLQAYPRKNTLTKALQEYGRLPKSIYIPNYLCKEDYRRKISTQLNKGESLNDLRKFLRFANEGHIRKSQISDQINQAHALTLLTNSVIIWNTRYMQAVINQLQSEGQNIEDTDLLHIYPCRFNHINKYGKYSFNVDREIARKYLRPLRKP